MKLLVVILNYKTADLALKSLDSALAQFDDVGGQAAVWVVDNRSPDNSVQVLREGMAARGCAGRVRLIESPRNGGYGAGNNLAFREALALPQPPTYFHVLNPDATLDPGALASLIGFMDQHPEVGVAGGLLRDEQGRPQCSTFRFPSLLTEFEAYMRLGLVRRLLHDHTLYMDPPATSRTVDWVSGASFIVRREAIERVGMFDERFFLYFEEVDLCRRIRAAGYGVHFVAQASVCHLSGASTGMHEPVRRVPGYWFESRRHYLRKFHGPLGLAVFNLIVIFGVVSQRLRQYALRQRIDSPHFLRDFIRYNFLGRRHTMPTDPPT